MHNATNEAASRPWRRGEEDAVICSLISWINVAAILSEHKKKGGKGLRPFRPSCPEC